jgi:hypothetical protein
MNAPLQSTRSLILALALSSVRASPPAIMPRSSSWETFVVFMTPKTFTLSRRGQSRASTEFVGPELLEFQ